MVSLLITGTSHLAARPCSSCSLRALAFRYACWPTIFALPCGAARWCQQHSEELAADQCSAESACLPCLAIESFLAIDLAVCSPSSVSAICHNYSQRQHQALSLFNWPAVRLAGQPFIVVPDMAVFAVYASCRFLHRNTKGKIMLLPTNVGSYCRRQDHVCPSHACWL